MALTFESLSKLAWVAILLLTLQGCGQKGDLYLPQTPSLAASSEATDSTHQAQ